MNHPPHLVLVGGFLGAGKTTLILAAAGQLARQGLRSAVILNDQGDALVDTALAKAHGLEAGEAAGGCFCCRFSDLMDSAERLLAYSPDVIFAEPVGSCTDLNATTVLPIQSAYRDKFRLAPLTVLVDPARARTLSQPDADSDQTLEEHEPPGFVTLRPGDRRPHTQNAIGHGVGAKEQD